MGLTYTDVRNQSRQVWGQFGEKTWLPNALKNSKLEYRDCRELQNSKIGKFSVLAAMGESLEANIDTLKANRDKFEITTCDKGFGALLDHGIKADYVVLCDAGIPFKWLEKYVDQTEGVNLMATAYANPEWTHAWKGNKYFYINKDAIETERKFIPIFGDKMRVMAAGSNVSNAMLIFWTGCDERSAANWSGYEKFLMVGYDYSWRPEGNYYAWNDPTPKRYYMHHRTMLDINGDRCFTSENLLFSAKWMIQYLDAFNLPAINCSGRGILDCRYKMGLQKALDSIRGDAAAIESCRSWFEKIKDCTLELSKAREGFQKSREGLIYGTR